MCQLSPDSSHSGQQGVITIHERLCLGLSLFLHSPLLHKTYSHCIIAPSLSPKKKTKISRNISTLIVTGIAWPAGFPVCLIIRLQSSPSSSPAPGLCGAGQVAEGCGGEAITMMLSHLPPHKGCVITWAPILRRGSAAEVDLGLICLLGRGCSFDLGVRETPM